MKKKKIFLTAFLAVTSIVSLASCSKKKKPADPVTPTNTGEVIPTSVDETEHSVYFIVDGEIVGSVKYKEGDTQILEYAVPKKDGYKGSWDEYILSDKDIYVTARYFKENVKYRVEYYLENLENSNYTVQENETQEFTVNPNTTVTPKIKAFDHFTCENPTISETISDEGDNVIEVYYSRDRYKVDFITNNDTTIDSKTVKYGTVLDDPELTKNGYNLIGYTANGKAFTFDTPVSSDLTIEAKFQAKDNIQYKINYYQENIDDDDYSLVTEDSITTTGNTDEVITAVDKQYQGFILDENKSNMEETIQADGSTVLNVYYNRKRFTVDFVTNTSDTLEPKTVKYGQTIYCPSVGKVGYTFNGYKYDENNFFNFNNPIYSNLTLTADFTPNNVSYKINYYLENLNDNNYTLSTESINSTAKSNSKITIDKLFQGYTIDETNSDLEGIVNPDGSTVLNVYYKRKQFNVNFITNNGEELEPLVVKYGTILQLPNLEKDGYTFNCWKFNNADYNTSNGVYCDLDLEAFYIPNDSTAFKIKYYFENLDDDNYTLDENYTTTSYGKTDSETQIPLQELTGYTLTNPNQTEIIKGDGSTVVKLYYKRRVYTVSYRSDLYSNFKEKQFKYGTPLKYTLPDETIDGYERTVYSSYYGYIRTDSEYGLDESVTYDVSFSPLTTTYKVEVYFENILDDGYTLSESDGGTWSTDTDSEVSYENEFDGYTFYSEISNTSAKVKYDGSTVLKLYYKRNRYTVSFKTNVEGKTIDSIVVKYEQKIDQPDLAKPGYTLDYWKHLDWHFSFDENITSDTELEAIWTPIKVDYKVEIYCQNILDDDYTLTDTKTYEQYTDYECVASINSITGFAFDNAASISTGITKADGSTTLKLYYNRNKEIVRTYNYDADGNWELVDEKKVKYGTKLEAPELTYAGYTLTDYNYDFSYPITEDINIYPEYTANTDTKYTINIYLENILDDEYTLEKTIIEKGTTDTVFSSTSYYNNSMKINHFSVWSYNDDIIKGDGSTVIDIYYTREWYNVSISEDECVSSNLESYYKYGTELTLTPSFNGNLAYDYLGIYNEDGNLVANESYKFTVTDNISLYLKTELKDGMENFGFNSSEKEITIVGFANDYETTDLVIPDCVTAIGTWAFYGREFNSITLGENVTEIRAYAFYNVQNENGVDVNLNNKLKTIDTQAFDNTKISSITFPESLEYIGTHAFSFSNITNINLPSNLTYIGDHAFNCMELTDVTINAIPKSVTHIGDSAFYNANLDKIEFEDDSNLEYIGAYAFSYANGGENPDTVYDSLIIPKTVKVIDDHAFEYRRFEAIIFEEGSQLEKLGSYAFALINYDDIVLPGITIPSSMKMLETYAFQYREFEYIRFEDGVSFDNEPYPFYNVKANKLYINKDVKGDNALFQALYVDEIIIPNDIKTIDDNLFFSCYAKKVTFEEGSILERIGDYAFGSSTIEEITLPETLTTIGEGAFQGCHFTSLLIPDNVEKIGAYAFEYCYSIKTLTIGESVYEIGTDAFNSVYPSYIIDKSILDFKEGGLDYGLIPLNDNTVIIDGEEVNTVEIKDGFIIKHIAENEVSLLSYIGKEKDVTIPNYVTSIGYRAFANADQLESVVISNHVTTIDDYAFYNCHNIRTVVIGDSVTEIGEYAFYNCACLVSLIVGKNVTTIGNMAFESCNALAEIYNKSSLELEANTQNYGYIAYHAIRIVTGDTFESLISFDDDFISLNYNDEVYLLRYIGEDVDELIIPDYFTIIASNSFSYNAGYIKSFIFGENIRIVEDYAFYYDNNYLESVTFNDKLEKIGNYAFSQCYKLKTVVLPDSVTEIGSHAFYYNYDLKITVGSGLKTIGRYAFASSLIEFNFSGENNIESIGDSAFESSNINIFELGKNLTEIGNNAFRYTYIYEIKNDSSITLTIGGTDNGEIAKYAKNIYSSTSGESKYIIDENGFEYFAFAEDDVLLVKYTGESGQEIDLVIPESVTEISDRMFQIMSFNTITISKNVKKIGELCFGQSAANKIIFEEGSKLEYIGKNAFQYFNIYDGGDFNLILPDGIKEIDYEAFLCSKFELVYIPSSIETFGDEAFFNLWQNLKYIIFDENCTIEEINHIFRDCAYTNNLMVVLPKSIKTINQDSINSTDYDSIICYYGTEAEWDEVTINNSIDYIVCYYSETENTDGIHWHFDENGLPVIWTAE